MHIGIRADGGPDIGYGHLTRTSSLAAEVISRGDSVTHLTRKPGEADTISPGSAEIVTVESVDDTIEWIKKNDIDIVVIDSYELGTDYQERIRDVVPDLAIISDDTRFKMCCDIVINGNVYAPYLDYEWVGDEPEWLLGPDYLLLRERFQELMDGTPPWREPPERALITFGGSDINQTTPEAMHAVDGFGLEVDVIIGPGFDNRDEIAETAREVDAQFNLLENPADLPERMFDTDFAISGTGVTVYELLAMGTPVVGIPQVKNQIRIADALENNILRCKKGGIGYAVSEMIENTGIRRRLRENGKDFIDGKGTQRVYKKLTERSTGV